MKTEAGDLETRVIWNIQVEFVGNRRGNKAPTCETVRASFRHTHIQHHHYPISKTVSYT